MCVFSCSVNEKYIRSYCDICSVVSSRSSSIIHLDVILKTDMSPSKAKSMRQRSYERQKLFDRKAIIISFNHNLNTTSIVLHLIFINDMQSSINHQIVWTRLPCHVVLWLCFSQRVMENILHLFWPCVAEEYSAISANFFLFLTGFPVNLLHLENDFASIHFTMCPTEQWL